MKRLILFFVALSLSAATFAQSKWTVDPMHSFVNFEVKHMGISFVNGSFHKFSGTIEAAKSDLTDAKISFTVDVNSISTAVEMRDNHLKSEDFFSAEKFPAMTFVSTSLKKLKGNTYELNGKLTIRDVTRDVKFNVVYGGDAKNQQGNTISGFQANTTIDRTAFNIKYDPTGLVVAKDIQINLNLEFAKAK